MAYHVASVFHTAATPKEWLECHIAHAGWRRPSGEEVHGIAMATCRYEGDTYALLPSDAIIKMTIPGTDNTRHVEIAELGRWMGEKWPVVAFCRDFCGAEGSSYRLIAVRSCPPDRLAAWACGV